MQNVTRRQFVLGSATSIAQFGLARSALAQFLQAGAVPRVDSLRRM